MEEITCTANFNQNIESPAFGSKDNNSYDLNVVISTTGFDGELTYDLASGEGVYIESGILYVDNGAFGPISVNVSDGKLIARAETELYGFYAKVNENIDNFKKQYQVTIKAYLSILPISNDVKSNSSKVPFETVNKRNR